MKRTMSVGRWLAVAAAVSAVACAAGSASAQSLFDRPANGAPPSPSAPASAPAQDGQKKDGGKDGEGQTAPAQQQTLPTANAEASSAAARGQEDPHAAARQAAGALAGYSLMVVVPPKPKVYAKHDLIEIIINENSSQTAEQNLKTDKKYDNSAAVTDFPSLRNLLEMQLRNGDSHADLKVGMNSKAKFDAKSDYARKDKISDRITAEVVDVKPNGNLVLEARRSRDSNGQTSTIVMSGVCRSLDITQSNTIQSSQLADLTLRVENSGEVNDGSEKGIITKVMDTLFNF